MVGAPDAQFPLEGFSMYYAPDIGKKKFGKLPVGLDTAIALYSTMAVILPMIIIL